MKLHIYQLAFIAFTAFTVSSCKDTDINDEHHYQNFYEFPIKLLNYLVIIYFAP